MDSQPQWRQPGWGSRACFNPLSNQTLYSLFFRPSPSVSLLSLSPSLWFSTISNVAGSNCLPHSFNLPNETRSDPIKCQRLCRVCRRQAVPLYSVGVPRAARGMLPSSSDVHDVFLLRFSGLWHHVVWCVGVRISEEYSASTSVSGEKPVLFLFPLDDFLLSSVRHKRVSCIKT